MCLVDLGDGGVIKIQALIRLGADVQAHIFLYGYLHGIAAFTSSVASYINQRKNASLTGVEYITIALPTDIAPDPTPTNGASIEGYSAGPFTYRGVFAGGRNADIFGLEYKKCIRAHLVATFIVEADFHNIGYAGSRQGDGEIGYGNIKAIDFISSIHVEWLRAVVQRDTTIILQFQGQKGFGSFGFDGQNFAARAVTGVVGGKSNRISSRVDDVQPNHFAAVVASDPLGAATA